MSDGNRPVVWQCVHCLARVPGVSPAQFPFCPFCGCPQSPRADTSVSEGRRCRNSNCREQLLAPTANFCHKCQTRQQQLPEQQQSEQLTHSGLSADSCDHEGPPPVNQLHVPLTYQCMQSLHSGQQPGQAHPTPDTGQLQPTPWLATHT